MKNSILASMLVELMILLTKDQGNLINEDLSTEILEMTSHYIDMLDDASKADLVGELHKVEMEYEEVYREDVRRLAKDVEDMISADAT